MTQKTEATFRYVILEAIAMHMESMDPLPSKLKNDLFAILEREDRDEKLSKVDPLAMLQLGPPAINLYKTIHLVAADAMRAAQEELDAEGS